MKDNIHKLFDQAIIRKTRQSKHQWANIEMDIAHFKSLSEILFREIREEHCDSEVIEDWEKGLKALLECIIDARKTMARRIHED